jgi:RNA polymerase sigma factor (TIGR02999 family)
MQAGAKVNREFEILYGALRARARRLMQMERHANSMSATVLLHETYLVLARARGLEMRDNRHLAMLAARVMKNLLIDRARTRKAAANGGALERVELNDTLVGTETDADRILAVAEAMQRLEVKSPRLAKLVELRFLCGFTEEEVSAMAGLSVRTVKRDWRVAKVRLMESMQGVA